MQKEIIGNATLYLGDCLEILPTLEKADHIITDPPYEKDAHTNARRLLTKGQDKGRGRKIGIFAINFSPMTNAIRKKLVKICKQKIDGWGLFFCQVEAIYLWRVYLEVTAGAKWKRACIWEKPDGAPQFTGDRPGMGYESIAVAWFGEGRSVWNGGGKHGVYKFSKSDPGYGHGGLLNEHETKKPLSLMKKLVSDFTQSKQIIIDPYMGSGSTGVACMNLDRRFIGIEEKEEHFNTACERIEQAQKQGRLFA